MNWKRKKDQVMGSREIVPSQADRKLRGRERGMDGWVKTEMEEAMEPNSVQTECNTNFRSFYLSKFESLRTDLLPDRSRSEFR